MRKYHDLSEGGRSKLIIREQEFILTVEDVNFLVVTLIHLTSCPKIL